MEVLRSGLWAPGLASYVGGGRAGDGLGGGASLLQPLKTPTPTPLVHLKPSKKQTSSFYQRIKCSFENVIQEIK